MIQLSGLKAVYYCWMCPVETKMVYTTEAFTRL